MCIVTISLAKGGAERSTALLSQMLYKKGFDVTLVTLNDAIDYEFGGKLVNLGLYKTEKDSTGKRLRRFRILKKLIKTEKFDYIIDNRNRSFAKKELYYLNYLYAKQNIIYVVRSFKLSAYFPMKSFVSKMMVKKAHTVVGVSQAITNEVNSSFKTDKALTIHNPLQPFGLDPIPVSEKQDYIIFLGRLEEDVKNFSLLINAYKKANLSKMDIKLKIFGDGPDKSFIENLVLENSLSDVVEIHNFRPDIGQQLQLARFLVLTSHYEGFPRVLIESLSVGTPVVSVNCKSGPSEIIENETNGLLVENYNDDKLAAAMDRMVTDVALFEKCCYNSKKSVARFSTEEISKKWNELLVHGLRKPR